MTALQAALKPCPFCGGVAYMTTEHDPDDITWHLIRCRGCGARSQGKWHSPGNDCPQLRAEVREQWNRRAALTVEPAAQRSPSQKLADAGYTRRPTWRSLPQEDAEPAAQVPAPVSPRTAGSQRR